MICPDNFNDFYDPKLKEQNISGIKDHPNFTLIHGDILDVELLEKVFSGKLDQPRTSNIEPRTMVHLAALAGVRPSITSPTQRVDVDIKGTVKLLEIAKECNIKQFIFGSSSSVYGVNEKVPFSEEDPTEFQISPYATAKKSTDQYCKAYNHGTGPKKLHQGVMWNLNLLRNPVW